MSKKRTLDSFFQSPSSTTISAFKKPRLSSPPSPSTSTPSTLAPSTHPTYPHPIPQLPLSIEESLSSCLPAVAGKPINDQPDLDLLYFQPYIPRPTSRSLFHFLRQELFYYRVQYSIKRGSIETQINTPRYTTVFGVDATSTFSPPSATKPSTLLDSSTLSPIPNRYTTCRPRPIPACLDLLRQLTEILTDTSYNFCLVNYYATGADSISYHSDDECFLGNDPAIASLSLGAGRDFLMKHKPPPNRATNKGAAVEKAGGGSGSLKLALGSGDMVLMRGKTQANWLHSIPKRKGAEADGGRINITFRKAIVKGGTENYYRYNVGSGGVWKWDEGSGEMRPWEGKSG